jgi:hypothetical protein
MIASRRLRAAGLRLCGPSLASYPDVRQPQDCRTNLAAGATSLPAVFFIIKG